MRFARLAAVPFVGVWCVRTDAGVPAYLGARRQVCGAGCKMAFGVSRRTWCGRSFLVGCPAGTGSNKVAGSWSQIIDWWTPARTADWTESASGRGLEGPPVPDHFDEYDQHHDAPDQPVDLAPVGAPDQVVATLMQFPVTVTHSA